MALRLFKHRLLVANSALLLAVCGGYWGHRVESAAPTQPDFLHHLRIPFRNWSVSELNLPEAEARLLQPDAVLLRRYESREGDTVELAVVAGRYKRTVHTPGFCMVGDGWEVVSQQSRSIPVANQTCTAIRAVMAKDERRLVATYFFTDGDYSTNSIVRFQWHQLLKRCRLEVPLGALVRVLVPIRTDQAAAEQLSDDFTRATLPPVMENLRRARPGQR